MEVKLGFLHRKIIVKYTAIQQAIELFFFKHITLAFESE